MLGAIRTHMCMHSGHRLSLPSIQHQWGQGPREGGGCHHPGPQGACVPSCGPPHSPSPQGLSLTSCGVPSPRHSQGNPKIFILFFDPKNYTPPVVRMNDHWWLWTHVWVWAPRSRGYHQGRKEPRFSLNVMLAEDEGNDDPPVIILYSP